MDIEEQQKRTIAEQRNQLMELREQLKQAKSSQKLLPGELEQLLQLYKPKPIEGKTLGLKISSMVRDRLNAASLNRDVKSYRQLVMVCIELGLRQMEEGQYVSSRMATVQDVLGANGTGNGASVSALEQASVSRGTGVLADN